MTRRPWTRADRAKVRREYPHRSTLALARELRRTDRSVYMQANLMGLRKTAAYLRSAMSAQFIAEGVRRRFSPGNKPWNAGLKGWDSGGRSHETRFQRGNRPQTYRPVGSERVNEDGILERKVRDPRTWRPVHVIKWETYRGRVPRGKLVIFRDRNPRNFRLRNLACVSRAELMGRNSIHRYPRELKYAMRLAKRLNRAIEART